MVHPAPLIVRLFYIGLPCSCPLCFCLREVRDLTIRVAEGTEELRYLLTAQTSVLRDEALSYNWLRSLQCFVTGKDRLVP